EQRPPKGRWAGMWQFVTIAKCNGKLPPQMLRASHGLQVERAHRCGVIRHSLTHRRYEFEVFTARARGESSNGTWVRLKELGNYPLSRPQLRIAAMITNNGDSDF